MIRFIIRLCMEHSEMKRMENMNEHSSVAFVPTFRWQRGEMHVQWARVQLGALN